MPQLSIFQSLIVLITAILLAYKANDLLQHSSITADITTEPTNSSMTTSALKQATQKAMSNLSHAKITYRPSSTRGSANHGWLDTHHSFSFASWYNPKYESFGSLRVLNEDRVAPGTGFPTHPHRDAEIFSYILSGELTHRDSMQKPGKESNDKDKFYRMKRGDVQFTTGGSGIAHSEQNEHDRDWVHFLQIWVLPWKKGLRPAYHTSTFAEADKREKFVTIITPLKAGKQATDEQEREAQPSLPGTIPIHADLAFSAGIIEPGKRFEYTVGAEATENKLDRKVYVHLPATKGGKASIKLDGRQDVILKEGDAAFVSNVQAGDVLGFESVGEAEAEVVVLDSN